MKTLQPADITIEWPRIRERVAELLSEGWPERPEDVYADCKHGRATLMMDEDGSFLVCRLDPVPNSTERVLFIWLASAAFVGAIDTYQPQIDAMAQREGVKTMRMWSKRSGWRKVEQWREVWTMYERVIE
jgi:hypothetical protein